MARDRRPTDCRAWRFVHVDEGYFAIVSARTGRPLVAVGGDGGPVALGRRGPGAVGSAGQWRIEALDTGGYRLVNRAGHAVTLDGARVRHAAPDGGDGQRLLLQSP